MGRTVIYNCDLCREEIKDLRELRTVFWSNKTFILKDVIRNEEVDKQICVQCINMIKNYEIK